MIVTMKRLMVLCTVRARQEALCSLRALGCVHITQEVRDGAEVRQAAAAVRGSERALRVLDVLKQGGTFVFKPEASSAVAALPLSELIASCGDLKPPQDAAEVNDIAERITRLREEAFALRLQLRRYEPFGEVDPVKIQALARQGVQVILFKVPQAHAAAVEASAVFFQREAGFVYGAWLAAEPLPAECELVPLPPAATRVLLQQAETAEKTADALMAQLAACSQSVRPTIEKQARQAQAAQVFALASANLQAHGEVACLNGYVPERAEQNVLAQATREGWGVVLETPAPDDPNVPVLLEPPRGFRAIGALFKGLGILPGYTEGDCSIPFYLFFSIFFAMLVGDAGYGAILLAAVLAVAWKLRCRAAARPVLLLMGVFSLSTIVWGVLSGTYFGIAKGSLPQCLQAIPTVAWLGDDNNLMFLCFLLGALHLSVARLWNAILFAPHLKMIGELGWLGVTWSMFLVVCGIVVNWFTQPEWTWWLLAGSVVLILVPLVVDIRHQGVSIGMLPLNVISAMGDIISYVRLFAVGLASVKVAENFNAMALGLDLPMVLRVLAVAAILLIGHGLNLAMGALSVLVHAVRLNTLEFSNAKGITWTGQPYTPFKQPQQ